MAKITESTEIFVPEYHEFHEIWDRHERAHWVTDDIKLDEDVIQWKRGDISASEQNFITMILRLFTQSDTNVCAGYVEKLLPIYKNADARVMLLTFANRETLHMKAYRLLNETLGLDSEAFFREFLSYKQMADKHMFMIEDVELRSNRGRAEYLAKQILMEGVNLFGSFAMLLHYNTRGLLPGMVSVNRWSIIDESMHIEGLTAIFRQFITEHPSIVNDEFKKVIYETARTVVKLEDEFIDLCYSVIDDKTKENVLNQSELKQYIRFVCDYRMQQMGLKAQFDVTTNPFPWIDDMTGNVFGNFFEVTVTEYSKGNLSGEWEFPAN